MPKYLIYNGVDLDDFDSEDIEPTEKEKLDFFKNNKLPSSEEELEELLSKIENEYKDLPVKKKIVIAKIIARNNKLSRLVKKRNNYVCEICGCKPFMQKNGDYYAEAHHRDELARGGKDLPNNMICVCPTCHKIIHYGVDEELEKRKV